MKKLLLLSLLITSLFAEAKIYLGVGGGYFNESYTDKQTTDASAEMARLKIGYGDINAYAVEFSFDYLKNKTNIFSTTGKDSDKLAINVELVKAFDFDLFFNPFFKAGFGAGFMDVSHPKASSLNYGSFNLGLGVFIPLSENFDIEISYDYRYVSYQRLSDDSDAIDSNMNGAYIGLNTRF